MIYEYECPCCSFTTDVIKHHTESGRDETCSVCSATMERIYTVAPRASKMERAEFNPAFGCVVKSKTHREQLAKERGMVEVGNEKIDNVHKIHENRLKEKLKKSWDDV